MLEEISNLGGPSGISHLSTDGRSQLNAIGLTQFTKGATGGGEKWSRARSGAQSELTMDRGKWSQQGVPHKGWKFRSFDDLGDLVGTCEMCESQSIRYVHYMEHPDYGYVLAVGSVCAGHMEEDSKAAQEREKQAKSRVNRRTNWMQAQWRESARGNAYINRNGFNIVVYARTGHWAYRIEERQTGQSWSGSRFASEDEAKSAPFERYVDLQK